MSEQLKLTPAEMETTTKLVFLCHFDERNQYAKIPFNSTKWVAMGVAEKLQ